jgi:hypothetical protein
VERQEPETLFFDIREEREAAIWRLKRAADRSRETRTKKILAQEGEGLLITFGRVVYLSACIMFDGLILLEIPIRSGRAVWAWVLYGILLGIAVVIQKSIYERWFDVDISQIDFD